MNSEHVTRALELDRDSLMHLWHRAPSLRAGIAKRLTDVEAILHSRGELAEWTDWHARLRIAQNKAGTEALLALVGASGAVTGRH